MSKQNSLSQDKIPAIQDGQGNPVGGKHFKSLHSHCFESHKTTSLITITNTQKT